MYYLLVLRFFAQVGVDTSPVSSWHKKPRCLPVLMPTGGKELCRTTTTPTTAADTVRAARRQNRFSLSHIHTCIPDLNLFPQDKRAWSSLVQLSSCHPYPPSGQEDSIAAPPSLHTRPGRGRRRTF